MTRSIVLLSLLSLLVPSAGLAATTDVEINLQAVEEIAGGDAAARVDAALAAATQKEARPESQTDPALEARNLEAARPEVGAGDALQILYARGNLVISPSAKETLDDWAASFLKPDSKVEILSYSGTSAPAWAKGRNTAAGAPQDDIMTYSLHDAIRTAFKRALVVRDILIAHGVAETNITVRALGPASDRGPAERIDVVALRG